MAYYNEEEDEFNPESGGQGVNLGNGPSSTLDVGSGAGSQSSSPKGDNPGNFVGLKTYLDANKNQANKFGEKVAGGVSNKINEAQSGINNFGNQFEQEARGGLIQGFDTAKDEAGQITNKAATGGLNALPTDQEKNRFGQIVNAQYSGPKTAQESKNYNPVRQSVMDAQKLADLSASESGSQELVKQFANKDKDYTQGASRLDSYLMQSDENKNRLAQARTGASALNPALQQSETKAGEYANKLQADTNQLKTGARDLLANTAMGKKASVQEQLSKQAQEAQLRNAQLQQYRNVLMDESDGDNLTLDSDQLAALGLSDGMQLFGSLKKDPNYYLPQEEVFDQNKAISREEQARLSALAGLSGTYGGGFTNPYGQSELAGTYQPTKFDPKELGSKIASEAQELQKQYENFYKTDKIGGVGGNKTPEYIENYEIPRALHQAKLNNTYGSWNVVRELQKSLEDWKASRKIDNKIIKSDKKLSDPKVKK